MSQQIHVFVGSVWRWQGFRSVTLPEQTRGDESRPKPPADAGVVQAVQASTGEPGSTRTSG